MSIRNLLRKLRRVLFCPDTARLKASCEELIAIGNKLLLWQRPGYRLHLQNLDDQTNVAVDRIIFSYELERVARKLNPLFIGHDVSRPTLCMVCVGNEYAQIVGAGTRTKLNYCKKHGYNMVILETTPYRFDRHPAWLRVPLLFRLMQMGYQHLFYLDADSIITNPDTLLEDFFGRLEKSGAHLMIAEDVYSLNTGSVFMRKTWQSLTLLDLVYQSDTGNNDGGWDQSALIALVEENPAVKSLLHVETNARQFNSMPFDRQAPGLPSDCSLYAWQAGDFICHFAGTRSRSELSSQMQKFHEMIPLI